jgi:Lrp/AsnC family transcriptional regulator, regulator for asnA, asnC and gidA
MARMTDEIDRSIILLLQQDGRASNVEMARVLGLAEGTVRKRIERLLADGVIRVVAVADPAAFGLASSFQIGIQVDLAHMEDVARRLAGLPEVQAVSLVTGTFDVLIEAVLPSAEHLLSFLIDKVSSIPGVKRTETSQVLQVVKRACDWSAPADPRRRAEKDEPLAEPASGAVLPGSIVVPS